MANCFLDSELTDLERDELRAKFRIIPMPLERTVSYGSGTAKGPAAILEASDQLERLCFGREPCLEGVFTETQVDCSGPLPDVMERLAERTYHACNAGKVPVTLGGEHSLTYGAVKGVERAMGRSVGIVQIDAHADLRKAYQNETSDIKTSTKEKAEAPEELLLLYHGLLELPHDHEKIDGFSDPLEPMCRSNT